MGFGDGAENAGESEAGRHFIQAVGGGGQHIGNALRGQGGHLFDAADQHHIVHPAGDGHDALAQGGAAAGAGVLHAGDGRGRHPQPVGHNGRGMPLMLKEVGRVVAQIAGLNVGGGDAGAGVNIVLQVVKSLHEQVAGRFVGISAKLRKSCANDGDGAGETAVAGGGWGGGRCHRE